jgi:ABC-type polysaccharide/polyol phosphate export permease
LSTSPSLSVRTYKAQARHGSILASLGQAASEVWVTRGIIWSLFRRDFLTEYRQKLLGYVWAFVGPLLQVATFIFLQATGILQTGDLDMPYPLFVFVGTGLWALFTTVIQAVATGVQTHGELVVRTGIPKFALALSGLANIAYTAVIHLVTLALLLAVMGTVPSWHIVFYPLLLVPLLVLGVGVGAGLAVLGTVARDVTSMAMTALGLLLFVTPVVYSSNFHNALLKAVVKYNPLTYLIEVPRSSLFGQPAPWAGYFLTAGCCLGLLILGIHAFYLIQDEIAERL